MMKRHKCGLCRQGVEVNDICGRLWHQDDCAAHHKCMQYSSCLAQYKKHAFGGFYCDEVMEEIKRGIQLRCLVCKKAGAKSGQHGATCGCAIKACRATFHYPCAKKHAITARMENKASKEVRYSVFCSKAHQEKFEKKSGNRYSYTEDTDTSDEDEEQMTNEHRHSKVTNGPKIVTSPSSIPLGDTSKASPRLGNRKRKRRRTRSISSSDSSDCNTSREKRSSKQRQRQVSENDTDSENDIDNQRAVLGTVEKCSRYDMSRVSMETNLTGTTSQSPHHDFVLCLVESDSATVSDQHKQEVTTYAEQLYNVGQKHVMIHMPEVDGTPLAAQHIIYLMQELSQVLREQNYPNLERLICGLSARDVNKYESFDHLHGNLGEERRKLIHTMMHELIKRNVSEADGITGLILGRLCKVSEKTVFILYLRICDVTDPVCRIRTYLCRKRQSIFRWTRDTCLTATCSAKTTEFFRQREAEELLSWLERNADTEVSCVDVSDGHALTCTSAILQLKEHFNDSYNSQPHGSSTLVLLGPIDETPAAYVKRWIPEILDRALRPDKDVFIVLGFNVSHTTCRLADLTPALLDNVCLDVYSFADPRHLPVTCFLLHFEMSAIKQEFLQEAPSLDDIWELHSKSPELAAVVCNVHLSGSDFGTMRPKRDIVDNVIQAYIQILVRKHDAAAIDCHVTNMLIDKPHTASLPRNIFRTPCIVLAPFNTSGDHWELLAFHPTDRIVVYVNPLGEQRTRIEAIQHAWNVVMKRYPGRVPQGAWSVRTRPHTRQQDTHSCGVLVMRFAELLLTNQPLEVDDDIDDTRRQIAQLLLDQADHVVYMAKARTTKRPILKSH